MGANRDGPPAPDLNYLGWDEDHCRVCLDKLYYDGLVYEDTIGVCRRCTNIIVNLHCLQHSGEYWNWQNPSHDKGPSKKAIPKKMRWDTFKRDDFRCKSCSSRDNLCADHIWPESRGGETTLDNLQTLCLKEGGEVR